MTAPKKLFLIWNPPVVEDDVELEHGYFEQFDTLSDAIDSKEHGEEVEVFEASPKSLGKYRREIAYTKVEAHKTKSKPKKK